MGARKQAPITCRIEFSGWDVFRDDGATRSLFSMQLKTLPPTDDDAWCVWLWRRHEALHYLESRRIETTRADVSAFLSAPLTEMLEAIANAPVRFELGPVHQGSVRFPSICDRCGADIERYQEMTTGVDDRLCHSCFGATP